ncbi:MAG: hypothetical protein AAGC57_13835 [Pseudomonadota bacterium]
MPETLWHRIRRQALLGLALATLAAMAADAQQRPISPGRVERLEFRESRVGEAVRLISEVSGINVFASNQAANVPIDITIRDTTVAAAVAAIARVAGLSQTFDRSANAFILLTPEEFAEEIVVLRDGQTRIFTLRHQNVVTAARVIENLYGERVELDLDTEDPEALIVATGTIQESRALGGRSRSSFDDDNDDDDNDNTASDIPSVDTARLTAAELRRLQSIVGTGPEDGGGVGISLLVDELDLAPPIFVTISRDHNLLYVRTADLDALSEIQKIIAATDRPSLQVLLEMKILAVNRDETFRSIFNFGLSDNQRTFTGLQGQDVSGGSGFNLVNVPVNGAGSFFFQFLSENILAQIELLEQDNRVRTLSTPLLVATNNSPAELFVGDEVVLTRGVDTDVVTGSTGATSTFSTTETELRDVGQTLEIIPRVNADRTVSLAIRQESSTVVDGGDSIPFVSATGNVELVPIDTVTTARISGTVAARDGATIAFGGLLTASDSAFEQKVPVLGDVPILGTLFRGDDETGERTELILLVTPHVYSTGAEGERIARERLAELSRNDQLDSEGFSGSRNGAPPVTALGQEQSYLPLIRFASQRANGVFAELARTVRTAVSGAPVNVDPTGVLPAEPVAAWRRDNLYVTTLVVENMAETATTVELSRLRGDWLAAASETTALAPRGRVGSRAHLHLVSNRPFADVVRTLPVGGLL